MLSLARKILGKRGGTRGNKNREKPGQVAGRRNYQNHEKLPPNRGEKRGFQNCETTTKKGDGQKKRKIMFWGGSTINPLFKLQKASAKSTQKEK